MFQSISVKLGRCPDVDTTSQGALVCCTAFALDSCKSEFLFLRLVRQTLDCFFLVVRLRLEGQVICCARFVGEKRFVGEHRAILHFSERGLRLHAGIFQDFSGCVLHAL